MNPSLTPWLIVAAGLLAAVAVDKLLNAADTCDRIRDELRTRLDAELDRDPIAELDAHNATTPGMAFYEPPSVLTPAEVETARANDLAEIQAWLDLPLYDVPVNERRQR